MENEATISPFTEDIPTVKKATFEFDYPIYLEPGDYAVSLDSNSDKYSVVTYVLPSIQKEEQVTNKNSAISSLFGSLFLPKNIGSNGGSGLSSAIKGGSAVNYAGGGGGAGSGFPTASFGQYNGGGISPRGMQNIEGMLTLLQTDANPDQDLSDLADELGIST